MGKLNIDDWEAVKNDDEGAKVFQISKEDAMEIITADYDSATESGKREIFIDVLTRALRSRKN